MAEQSIPAGRKLMVEICNANNLMPKDGQGTASAFVVVDFDGQRRRTKTIARDLNPQWDERLEFVVHHVNEDSVASNVLELNVYNEKMIGKRSNFLGKAKIAGTSFSKAGSESLVYYPLEKRSVFSQVKGEIGIKVWYEDPVPPPAPETASTAGTPTNIADPSSKPAAPEAEVESQAAAEEKDKPAPEEDKKKKEDQNKKKSTTEEEKKPDLKEEKTKNEEEASSTAPESAETPAEATPSSSPPAAEVANLPIAQIAEKIREEKPKQSNLNRARSSAEMDLRSLSRDRGRAGYDLVDRMPFLYVRVVKAKRLPNPDPHSSSVFAKLVIGTHSVKTKSQSDDKDWDQVFAFDKAELNSTSLEISVWTTEEKATDGSMESCLGTVMFDLQEVPKRVPPDSPLAPQWYTLEGIGTTTEGTASTEVMVAVWVGTQADEAFQESWQSDSGGFIPETRAKVYLSPKLWYLRLTVIQTQDLQLGQGTPQAKARGGPELYVKGQLGAQLFKTSRATSASPTTANNNNPTWNDDLIFVAAEPFEPFLVVTVEDGTNGKPVGYVKIQVAGIERRTDDWVEPKSRWFNLVGLSDDQKEKPYAGRIHMRVCLEGGYHVLDEAAHVTSDVQASAKQLGKAPIGLLEVGIRGASNLLPVKTKDGTRGTTDAYVVAKYGQKWVRTRTIVDRFNPRWNEQYAWDIYDPCTVLTIGIFDNGRYCNDNGYNYKQEDINISSGGKATATGRKDVRIGKLRVRLSTLDINRVHLNNHPLTVLLPGGAKRMGEIEIAIRFTCSSWISLIQAYSNPMLPRMHYIRPLGPARQDILRHTAMRIVIARLARSEPALGQEVVQFMLDTDCHVWSMRKSKVNWFRVVGGLSKLAMVTRWIDGIRTWVHTPTTVLVHIILVAVVLCPHLVLPTIFMYAFMILALRVRYRQKIPIGVDPRLSYVDMVSPDELDEELDGFPSTRPVEVVRMRYDRLRALAGKAQTFLGDIAAQWERMEALYNWRDPRATAIFVVFCFMASLLFYVVPFGALVLGLGFYYLRHPRFRGDMPSVPANFFRRLPSLSDQIL